MKGIYILIILLILPSIYKSYIIYRPKAYVKPIGTHAVPPEGGLLLDGELLQNVLNRYNISIKDIVIPYKYVYFIVPLVDIGVYIDGKVYIRDETSNWERIISLFRETFNKNHSRCGIVVSPIYTKLIIIGSTKELKLVHNPLTESKPRLILYINGKVYNEFKWVMVLPLTIMDLDPSITTFYIVLRENNETYTSNKVYNILLEGIENRRATIEENKGKPWILYEGPRKEGVITYINNWPVILLPEHDICNIVGQNNVGIDYCIKYPTHVATGKGNIWIIVHTYLGDQYGLEQIRVFIEKYG